MHPVSAIPYIRLFCLFKSLPYKITCRKSKCQCDIRKIRCRNKGIHSSRTHSHDAYFPVSMTLKPCDSRLYSLKRIIYMAVILSSGRYTECVHTIFVQPLCSALRHKIIRIISKQSYECTVSPIWILVICSVEPILLDLKKLFFHNFFLHFPVYSRPPSLPDNTMTTLSLLSQTGYKTQSALCSVSFIVSEPFICYIPLIQFS